MNYIYDIVLNFNKEYYNFFEWKKSDNCINVKKIPLFLVDNDTFKAMKYNQVTVDKDFIGMLNEKTLTYTRSGIGPSCLISNGKEAIGLLFDTNGFLVKRSSLLLDEEEEVLEEVTECNYFKINIVKEKKINFENVNRIEKERKRYLLKYLSKEKNEINLKYLYYDYFEKDEEDIAIIRNILISEIKNNWNSKTNSLYDLVKLFNRIKN